MSFYTPDSFDLPPITDPPAPPRRRRGKKAIAPKTNSGRPVVLQVLPRLVSGGVERGTIEIARAIKMAGGTPLVASGGGPMERDLRRAGITHITLPLYSKNPWTIWQNIGLLKTLITSHDVDIIHARSRAPAWSALAAARQTGCHFVTTVHAAYKFSSEIKKFYNSSMVRGDRVIAISSFIERYITEHYDLDPELIRLVPRGVDLTEFHPERIGPARTQALYHQWQIPAGRPVIMMPGRISRWKGQRELIEAIAMMNRRDFVVLIVGGVHGKDHYQAELETLVTQHNLGAVVRFVGRCEDMPAALMLADIVVSTSYDPEGFGRVVAEAMAMAKPVIVADHGAVPELVQHMETGWIIPPRDQAGLADAIQTMLTMPAAQRADLGCRAQAHITTHFSRDLMCQRTMAVYDELLAMRLMQMDSVE